MFQYILSKIAANLLWLGGWSPLTPIFKETFFSIQRRVIIFPHTTLWDFIILALYALCEWPEYESAIYIIVKPQLFEGAKKHFFWFFNCIPATKREDRGQGFIDKTINLFTEKDNYSILISPEGTVIKNEWKSGYFYLAKGLNCPIQVIGLDYNIHTPIMITPLVIPSDHRRAEKQLKEQMSTISPLYRKNSILNHPNLETSLFSFHNLPIASIWYWFYLILTCLIPYPGLLWISLFGLTYFNNLITLNKSALQIKDVGVRSID